MKYPEYLSSAKRHNHACRVLIEKIESLNNDEGHCTHQGGIHKDLTISLYYLSGYIIECALKYKILELLGFDISLSVDKDGCDASGLIKYKRLKTHNLIALQERLTALLSDLEYECDNCKVEELLNKWNPEIRYMDIPNNYQDIKAFYINAKEFMRKM